MKVRILITLLIAVILACLLLGGCTQASAPTTPVGISKGSPSEEGVEVFNDFMTRQIGADRRKAVFFEFYYALRKSWLNPPNEDGPKDGKKYGQWIAGDWNYLNSDLNAYNAVQSIVGKENCSIYPIFYSDPAKYGIMDGYGRAGQCTYGMCLLLYRALGGFKFSTNVSHNYFRWSDLNPDVYPLAKEGLAGDLVFTKVGIPHIAVLLKIIDKDTIEIGDSNWIGTEMIGRHTVPAKNYRLITGDAKRFPQCKHKRWYNL